MPIYEFHCPDNNTIYSFLAPRPIGPGEVPRCPANAAYRMERVMSAFAITRGGREEADGGEFGDDPDDARMEAAMAQLESEMVGMDENNPDPRQMGRLMRRMADITGEPLTGDMEAMVRKMEEGHDLDALEEEFGDAMEGDDDLPGEGEPDPGSAAGKVRAMLRARRQEPRRDPELYDWREYLG